MIASLPLSPPPPPPALRRSARRVVGLFLLYAVALAFGVFLILWRQAPPENAQTIRSAIFAPDTPSMETPQTVNLPHRCRRADGAAGCAGVYHLTFQHDGASIEPTSIYVPTFNGRIVLWVNGAMATDSRRLLSGAVVNQAGPLLTMIPAPLLRHGENMLDIRLEAWDRTGGFLDPVAVGPDAALRPVFALREMGLGTLPRLLASWLAALCLSLFIVWIGRREEPVYLAMSAVLGFSVLQSAPLFVAAFDWPEWALRSVNLAGLWQTSLFPGILTWLTGGRSVATSGRMLIIPVVFTVGFAVMTLDPATLQPWFAAIWPIVALPWAVCCLVWSTAIAVSAAFRRGQISAHCVFAGLLTAIILSSYDLTGVLSGGDDRHIVLSRFAAPLLMTVISATLMWRFAMALKDVSRFADVLRQEKAALETQLRASFAREEAQRRASALEGERVRLTRDLHDGLAGQLVSIVAQCGLPSRDFDQVGLAARRALDDLRLVVASLEDVGDDLALMLAQFHDRIGPQLRAQGVELDWRMAALPDVKGLRSEHALALFRILQEAVTNAVRHSGSRKISIVMSPGHNVAGRGLSGHAAAGSACAVRIMVMDGGKGGVVERPGGRGLANMRRRAESLGAVLTIESDESGARVIIDLPPVFPGAAAP